VSDQELHRHQDKESAGLDRLAADLVLLPEHLQDYWTKADALRDELIYFHANLRLLSQIRAFPATLFEAPPALLGFVAHSLTTECVHICYRILLDQTADRLTLHSLRGWLVDTAVRPEYRDDLRRRLRPASISRRANALAEGLRGVRHAYLAHLDYPTLAGLKSVPRAVPFGDLRILAGALARYFNAMLFGATQMFVPAQFGSDGGPWYEGDLGYILEQVAIGSKWFTAPVENPEFFARVLRPQLTDEDLRAINTVRRRRQMEPLV
jgi:hypothetical protein